MEKEEVGLLSQDLEDILERIVVDEPEDELVENVISDAYSIYSGMYDDSPSELVHGSMKYMFQQIDQMILKARRLTPEDDYIKDRYKFMLSEGTFFTIGLAY